MNIHLAGASDHDAVWQVMEPIIRSGQTVRAAARDDTRGRTRLRVERGVERPRGQSGGDVLGTYCLRKVRPAGGSHIANCGYMVGPWAAGQGVGRAMCEDSIERARALGFRGIQYNFVVSTNSEPSDCIRTSASHRRPAARSLRAPDDGVRRRVRHVSGPVGRRMASPRPGARRGRQRRATHGVAHARARVVVPTAGDAGVALT